MVAHMRPPPSDPAKRLFFFLVMVWGLMAHDNVGVQFDKAVGQDARIERGAQGGQILATLKENIATLCKLKTESVAIYARPLRRCVRIKAQARDKTFRYTQNEAITKNDSFFPEIFANTIAQD